MTGQGQLITGLVVGAGAMYVFDPECGTRRRALLQEKAAAYARRQNAGRDPEAWSPGMRVILSGAGGLLAVKGLRTRGVAGQVLTALGTAILARAASGTPPQPLVDLGSRESSVARPGSLAEREEPPVESSEPDEKETVPASAPRRATKSTKPRRSQK